MREHPKGYFGDYCDFCLDHELPTRDENKLWHIGWHMVDNGKHMCPECYEKMWQDLGRKNETKG
jgi:hypothetical protein